MSTDVFSVIADPTRRRILRAVRERARAVNDVVAELGVSQPTVSKHLKVLREAGLVTVRAQGQRRLYSLEPAPLAEVRAWLEGLLGAASGGEQTAPEAVIEAPGSEVPAPERTEEAETPGAGEDGPTAEPTRPAAQGPAPEPERPAESAAQAPSTQERGAQPRRAHRRTPARFQPLTPLPAPQEQGRPPAPEPFDLDAALAAAQAETPSPADPTETAAETPAASPARPRAAEEISETAPAADSAAADPDVSESEVPAETPGSAAPVETPTPAEEEPHPAGDPLAHRPADTADGAEHPGFLATLFGRKRGR